MRGGFVKALVKAGAAVGLQELPRPEPGRAEVLIRVRAAGLCRTDRLVMNGSLPARDPLIPGHELAGELAALGPDVNGWSLGDRVTVHPMLGCGACAACHALRPEHCPAVRTLGIDVDGAFAEYLRVPARALWRLPSTLGWREGAYAEPVAAALGVLRAEIRPGMRGAVAGQNRIAALTRSLLALRGYEPEAFGPETLPESLDYLVESGEAELEPLLAALRPGGLLIAKSRHLARQSLPWSLIVRKDLRIQGIYYGDFGEAIGLLAEAGPALTGPLFGASYAIADWQRFIGPDDEQGKRFLVFD